MNVAQRDVSVAHARDGTAGPTVRGDEAHHAFSEEPVLGKAYDARLVRYLWPFLRSAARQFVFALALLAPMAALSVAQPYLLKTAIDRGFQRGGAEVLAQVALLFIGALVLEFFVRFGHVYLLSLAGQRSTALLRSALFRHLQRFSLRTFDRTPVGRLTTRVTSDVDNINEAFSLGLTAVADVVQLGAIVAMMLALNLRLGLVTLGGLPVLMVVVELFRRRARVAFREIRAKIARINAYLSEQVQGMTVVQAFCREERCAREFDEINSSYRDANYRAIRYDVGIYAVVDALGDISVAAMLVYAAARIAGGALSAGVLIAFIELVRRFFIPVRELSSKYTVLQSAMASTERIVELMEHEDLDAPCDAAPSKSESEPVIELEHVSFGYGREEVLHDVSLAIRRGEKVAFVGATGAGKTTVLALVQRLYEPARGFIRIAGADVRTLDRAALARRFAAVPQDVFLFSGSILRNIAVADPSPDPRRVAWALEQVGAGALVERLGGLQAEVSERGANFSAGERQLLSFARALYRDPEILLLDEATASVDSETEALLQAAVQRVMADRTALVVAHRLSTVRNADKIVVMHKGRIAEQGTHEELLGRSGIYARLHRLQLGTAATGSSSFR